MFSQNSFPYDVTRISGLLTANSACGVQDTKEKWKLLYVDIQFRGSFLCYKFHFSGFEEYETAYLSVSSLDSASPRGCGDVTITR